MKNSLKKKLMALACVLCFLAVTGFMFDTNTRWGNGTFTGTTSGPTFNATTYQVGGIAQSGTGPLAATTLATLTTPAIGSPTTTGTDAGAETLKTKTLTGAASGNSVTLLSSLKQDATAQLTGNAADQTVWTFSVPGSTIESGKSMDLDIWISHDVGSATIIWKITYGTAVVSCAVGGAAVNEIHLRGMISNNNGSTAAQRLGLDCLTVNTENTGTATGAVDTTASQTLTFSFNVANTDKITGHSFRPIKP